MLAAQCDALPEHGTPGKLLEAATNARHITQLAAIEPTENAHNGLVGQAIKEGATAIRTFPVPGRRSNHCAVNRTVVAVGQSSARSCGWRAAGNDAAAHNVWAAIL